MKKLTSLFTTLSIVVNCFSQTTPHGIDANWYPAPKTAVTSATPNLSGAVANNVVVKSNGTVIIFYRQGVQNNWIQSSDGGNSWSSPGTLYSPAVNGLSTITADIDANDNIYLAWKSGNFSLGFAKYNGSTVTATYTINTQTQTASDTVQFSQITVDRKGRIHLMWQQGNHQNFNPGIKSTCWYALSQDGGQSFTTSLLSSGNAYHAAFPIADFGGTDHDTLMIAWRENVNGCSSPAASPCSANGWNWDVKARISRTGGTTWQPVFTLQGSNANDADDDQWDPNIVVDKNGVIHVFYHIYHNLAMPDLNAAIFYEYSLDGGTTWNASPIQLSTTGTRSHLVKTAYDHMNNYVWCAWKDETDFGNIQSNPQADLKVVSIENTGTPVIGPQEFLCDHLIEETAFHNFKVGNDGILRATYNISKAAGKGDIIYYTQRSAIITGISEFYSPLVEIYPNPATDFIYIHSLTSDNLSVKVSNALGGLVANRVNDGNKIYLPCDGIFFVEVYDGRTKQTFKIIKH